MEPVGFRLLHLIDAELAIFTTTIQIQVFLFCSVLLKSNMESGVVQNSKDDVKTSRIQTQAAQVI